MAKETTQADIEMMGDWLGREVVENSGVGVELRRGVGRKSGGGEGESGEFRRVLFQSSFSQVSLTRFLLLLHDCFSPAR